MTMSVREEVRQLVSQMDEIRAVLTEDEGTSDGSEGLGISGRRKRPRLSGMREGKQRNAANARERDRTHSVNSAFSTLRTLIPTEPADRKLSKIETLRLASSYIAHLATVLMAGTDLRDQPCLRHQMPSLPGEPSPKPVCTFCLSGCKKTQPRPPPPPAPEHCYYKDDLTSFILLNRR